MCFLHSYANDDHELRMREVLEREHPDCVVSISSEVLREYREYERSVTTLVDAAVKPRLAAYVSRIRERLDEVAPDVPFYVMKSNGGVLSAAEVVRQPITTVLSGPAAGALGAAVVAARAGFGSVLTLDGGGTSTDVSVVLDGRPTLTTEGTVGAYPSKIPMIDIVTVGAGGGSIASRSPEGTLKVGPQSAGADPGPLCYGRGGTAPTVTDAHVVLGRIPPHLLGGEIPLDVARRAQRTRRARPRRSGSSSSARPSASLEISAWNQANAIRQVTVRRGIDVRELAMVAFGGSGPLLVCRLIDILGLPAVVVPPDPGNLSAYGLLTVDVRNDDVQTAVQRDRDLDLARVAATYETLERRSADALAVEGFAEQDSRLVRSADLRYDGQAYEVRVDAPAGQIDGEFQAAVVESFHRAHEQLYGYCYRGVDRHAVEWVNLRVTGIGPIARPVLDPRADGDGKIDRARTGERQVYFDDWVSATVFDRSRLEPGDVIIGPAVVEEFGSTVPVHPGYVARVDAFMDLVVSRA